MTNGFITVACGKPLYLELAVNLALSLRRHSEQPCSILVDRRLWKRVQQYTDLFDQILLLPKGKANISKHSTAEFTPYNNTIFLDADLLAVGAVDSLFAQVASCKTGYVVQGEYLPPTDTVIHNERCVADICGALSLPRYLKTNSGIMGFRKNEGKVFQDTVWQAEATYRATKKIRNPVLFADWVWLSDEILIGIAGAEIQVDFWQQPVPMRWSLGHSPNESVFWHLIGVASKPVAEWLRAYVGQLRNDADLPVEPGVQAVHRKLRRSK